MATLYTVLVNAGNGPRISDGVDQATVPASDVFPYLPAAQSRAAETTCKSRTALRCVTAAE